jgi:hypothetical protein
MAGQVSMLWRAAHQSLLVFSPVTVLNCIVAYSSSADKVCVPTCRVCMLHVCYVMLCWWWRQKSSEVRGSLIDNQLLRRNQGRSTAYRIKFSPRILPLAHVLHSRYLEMCLLLRIWLIGLQLWATEVTSDGVVLLRPWWGDGTYRGLVSGDFDVNPDSRVANVWATTLSTRVTSRSKVQGTVTKKDKPNMVFPGRGVQLNVTEHQFNIKPYNPLHQ